MSDIELRHLTEEERLVLVAKLENCLGFEMWMHAFISFHAVSYYSGMSEMTVITCWHPDSTPFYTSCDPQACVNAFAEYPYNG